MGTFGKRLKILIEEKNITQSELAKILGQAESTISQWVNGRRNPESETLQRIADFFNTSIDYLLCRTDTRMTTDELATRTIEEAISVDPELLSFFKELKKRDDLKILFKQVRPLPPKIIRRITRLIKAVQDEEDMED